MKFLNLELNKKYIIILIAVISLFGGAMIFFSTQNGPWGYSDSAVYISSARGILNGDGLGYFEGNAKFNQLTIFAPFTSLLLGFIGLFNIDLIGGMRWISIISFTFSIFISGLIFLRFSHTPVLGIFSSILMCIFPHMIRMFSSTMSEPLFILLFMISGICLLEYLKTNKSWTFILCVVILGLVPITRYVGISVLVSATLMILLFSNGNLYRRFKKTILFGFLAIIPTIVWFVRLYFIKADSVVTREVSQSIGGLSEKFQQFRGLLFDNIWEWIPFVSNITSFSYRYRLIVIFLLFAIFITLSVIALCRLDKNEPKPLTPNDKEIFIFFELNCVLVITILLITFLFTEPGIDIDGRILLPLFVSMVIAALSGFSLWYQFILTGKYIWSRKLFLVVIILSMLWYLPQSYRQVLVVKNSITTTSFLWENSETVMAIRSLPKDQPVISNDWELLMLWTNRPVYGFWNFFPTDPVQTSIYGQNINDPVQRVFCEQGAALVIFHDFNTQADNYLPNSDEDISDILFSDIIVYGEYQDGTIYFCK